MKAAMTFFIIAWCALSYYGNMKGWSINHLIPFREEDSESGT